MVFNGHAQQHDDFIYPYDSHQFLGISLQGLPNGVDAQRHGDGASRLSVITRGLVTVMCDYEDIKDINLLSFVKVKTNNQKKYKGFDPKTNFYSIEATNNSHEAIGILYSKPDRRHKSNEVKILLL